ncbi:udp-glycosyltransferase 91a1 [Quercus suber]|uniref:Udp-glycosyltransferase 91a1 n=1 Tax=Quercus suber TaxID=58331 RepID=A0AAW0KNN2_QUESU
MANEEKLHIAIFPWLAYGQVMPYFELSKFLAQKGHKVSFISAPKNIYSSPPKFVITDKLSRASFTLH